MFGSVRTLAQQAHDIALDVQNRLAAHQDNCLRATREAREDLKEKFAEVNLRMDKQDATLSWIMRGVICVALSVIGGLALAIWNMLQVRGAPGWIG